MSMSEDELFASPVSTYKILVLCVGNTCRSIMYHSILKEQNRPNIEVFSAGFKAKKDSISEFTNQILNDFVAVTNPRFMRLTAEFKVRGGIYTTVVAEHKADGWQAPVLVNLP